MTHPVKAGRPRQGHSLSPTKENLQEDQREGQVLTLMVQAAEILLGQPLLTKHQSKCPFSLYNNLIFTLPKPLQLVRFEWFCDLWNKLQCN